MLKSSHPIWEYRSVFKVQESNDNDCSETGSRPERRALYKPPLAKRVGDLQWKIVHGAIAVKDFITVLNPKVGQECPFLLKERLFSCFPVLCKIEAYVLEFTAFV